MPCILNRRTGERINCILPDTPRRVLGLDRQHGDRLVIYSVQCVHNCHAERTVRAERERRPFDNNERGTSHFPDFPLLIVHSCEAIYCAASVTARPVASRSMALRNGPLRYASSSGVGDSFVRVIVPPMVLGDRLPPAVRGPPSRNRGRSHHPPTRSAFVPCR